MMNPSAGRAGELRDPVGLPGAPLVVGERLLPASGIRTAASPEEVDLDRSAIVLVVPVEVPLVAAEATEDRRIEDSGAAGGPVDGPAPLFRVEQAHAHPRPALGGKDHLVHVG